MKYDVLIVGGGPSGFFSAYKIIELKPWAKVLVLEMGKSLKDRKCIERELGKCVKCKICAVTHGKNCETTIKGLYGIGDGAGPTHGLMPASVNGVFLGSYLASII